jgi:transposase
MREGEFRLTPNERRELRDRLRSRTLPAEDVRRARLILLLAQGKSYLAIRDVLGCNPNYISRWKGRFEAERLAGLYSHHPGRAVEKRTPALEARILEWTRRPAPDGSTHWSSRKLARHLGISHMMVARVWQRAGLKPHRIERYMASDDPDFELKAADIIGLYVKPPQHAAVFCVDEKTAIQALDRLDPVLPLSPGRLERHGFEYYRHGTLSLYVALNTRNGAVLGKTAARHTSRQERDSADGENLEETAMGTPSGSCRSEKPQASLAHEPGRRDFRGHRLRGQGVSSRRSISGRPDRGF